MNSDSVNDKQKENMVLSDNDVLEVAEKIMDKYDEAFKELAK